VAKEASIAAAKSLFSFATNLTKSVIDVAQNVTAVGAGGSQGLASGSTVTISRTKVQVVRMLSEGGFGTVYLVKNDSGKNYALKHILCQTKEQVTEAHKEIDALLLCQDQPYIIHLLDHASTLMGNNNAVPRQILLLFPLYPRGTAWDCIERAGLDGQDSYSPHSPPWPFSEAKAVYLIYCVASALAFLHQNGYSHRDVKPHNILISDEDDGRGNQRGILMDLGSVSPAKVNINSRQDALKLEDEAATKTSAAYRSPELTSPPIPPFVVDERVDTWGLGCTMFCLAFGRSPFETSKEGVLRLAIMNGKYSFPPNASHRNCKFSEAFINLIDRMLQVDITRRPFMPEIVSLCEKWR
jgi:serine/threonine kinase 16